MAEAQLVLSFDHTHEALERLRDGNEPGQRLVRCVTLNPGCTTAELSRRSRVKSVGPVVEKLNSSTLQSMGLSIQSVDHGGGIRGWQIGLVQ